jgi:glycerol-3-phosphate acyltransferase PlsY
VGLAGLLLISYLIGAVPSALIAGRLLGGIDIRKHGSGNVGGTNAWRVLGWKAGLPVSIVDVGKGAVAATLIPRLPFGPLPVDPTILPILCGVAAVIGHVFPVYTRFRGGKGVATAGGMLAAIAPIPVGMAAGVFAVALFLTGWVSLGSLLGALTVPLAIALLDAHTAAQYPSLLLGLTSALAAFIWFTHRGNIVRLVQGTERRFPNLQIWRLFLRR